MRVHTPQHNLKPQLLCQRAHTLTEEPRPRPEVSCGRLPRAIDSRIRSANAILHLRELHRQLIVSQTARRLVVHGMVGELMAAADEGVEGLLAAGDLRADQEEGGCGIIFAQGVEDVSGVGGGGVVDGQGDEFLGRGQRDVPEGVGPVVLEVADQEGGRLVDAVERREKGEGEEEGEEHDQEAFELAAGEEHGRGCCCGGGGACCEGEGRGEEIRWRRGVCRSLRSVGD